MIAWLAETLACSSCLLAFSASDCYWLSDGHCCILMWWRIAFPPLTTKMSHVWFVNHYHEERKSIICHEFGGYPREIDSVSIITLSPIQRIQFRLTSMIFDNVTLLVTVSYLIVGLGCQFVCQSSQLPAVLKRSCKVELHWSDIRREHSGSNFVILSDRTAAWDE